MRPTRIPLFPLDVVLFPGMPLPLHIFEERYKLMIAVCLREKLEFGIVFASEKEMATVGCTAAIIKLLNEYLDGRMDVLTEGRVAFRSISLLHEKAYHEAFVEYLPEDVTSQNPQQEARLIELFQLCHSLLSGQPWVASDKDTSVSLAYSMAAPLPMELQQKQELLEMRDETDRRDFLVQWISEFLPRMQQRERIRKRSGGNGHGR
jgi:Lon protease-like protein